MSKLPVFIIKNEPHESGGLIEQILARRKIASRMFDLKAGDEFPDPTSGSALIVLGGPASSNDTTPLMQNELKQVRRCLKEGIPYLGICLGLQVMVKAAGGEVLKSPMKEIGFFDPDGRPYEVELTFEGATDPLFRGFRQKTLRVFQLHGETVNLVNGLHLLAVSAGVPNQIVRAGKNAYGIQCHFELTPEIFEIWLREDADLKRLDATKLRQEFEAMKNDYLATGTRLIENFLQIAGLIRSVSSSSAHSLSSPHVQSLSSPHVHSLSSPHVQSLSSPHGLGGDLKS